MDRIDYRINEIEYWKMKAFNTFIEEEYKKEHKVSEEYEDSDEEGIVRQSINTNQQITKCMRKSETEVFYFHIFIIGRNQT